MAIDLASLLVAGVRDGKILEQPIPPATELEVVNFEKRIGHDLPADYRRFLLTINGGMVNRNITKNVTYNVVPMLGGSEAGSFETTLGYMFTLYPNWTELLEAKRDQNILTLNVSYIYYEDLEGAGFPFPPPDCVPIASAAADNGYLLLVLAGNHKNKVLYYDYSLYPDEVYGNVWVAANSFSEFVGSLRTE